MTTDRIQTTGEEIANSVSHGIAILAALIAYPFLVVAARDVGTLHVVAVSVFAITTVLLYFASTLFHALPDGTAKRVFNVLDHGAIYLLIAGTYTPFTLGILRGALGWTLFCVIWSLAIAGCLWKAVRGTKSGAGSTVLYLAMGWIILFAADEIYALMPVWGLFWLLAGGAAYTLGTIFFALSERYQYCHFVWHLFVIAGTTCHFFAVLGYSA